MPTTQTTTYRDANGHLVRCETVETALSYRTTHTTVISVADPSTGEITEAPLRQVRCYVPKMQSSWVGWISYEATRGTRGDLAVFSKTGKLIYQVADAPAYVLLNILRGVKIAKSTDERSVGATIHYYMGRRRAARVNPWTAPIVVNGHVLSAR